MGGKHVGEGEMVILDLEGVLGESAPLFHLPFGAEIDDCGQTESGQLGAVVLVQPGEAVGPEEAAPADAAPVGAGVSTEVAEVHTS